MEQKEENASIFSPDQQQNGQADNRFSSFGSLIPLNLSSTSQTDSEYFDTEEFLDSFIHFSTPHSLSIDEDVIAKVKEVNRLTRSEKRYSKDGKEYIKKIENGLLYSAVFTFNNGHSNSHEKFAYKIDGKRNLLIADCNMLIALIQVNIAQEFDFTSPFMEMRNEFLKKITITEILKYELLDKRNEAYNHFNEILISRSNTISESFDVADDLLQVLKIATDISNHDYQLSYVLQEVIKNEFISTELKDAAISFLKSQFTLLEINHYLPKFGENSKIVIPNLCELLRNISKTGVKNHKQNLLKRCPTQNSYLLCQFLSMNNLPNEKLLFINNKDIELFAKLASIIDNELISLEFIGDLWNKFYVKLENIDCTSVKETGSLTHPIYFCLLKSFQEIILEITAKSTIAVQALLKREHGKFHTVKSISWKTDSPIKDSLERQYRLILKLLEHFEPGSYTSTKKFNYQFKIFKYCDSKTIWERIKSIISNSREKDVQVILNIPEERLIWCYILDCGIAPILGNKSNSHFKELSLSLVTGFVKFIEEAKHDRYETFRLATHNIIKFAMHIHPHFYMVDGMSKQIDHAILEKQMKWISDGLRMEDTDFVSNHFANLMDVYNEYWNHREAIVGKLPVPGSIFKEDVEAILLKLLTIVDKALSKKVETCVIIQCIRLYNEFVKHLKAVEFTWLVLKKYHYGEAVKVLEKVTYDEQKLCYRVTNPEKFISILVARNEEIPRHYLIETIKQLLDVISICFEKNNWSNEDCIKATGDLLLAIGHSFIHFKEQPGYIDFDYFLRDSTRPFHNVITNSDTYRDFKTRLDNVENFYLYTKKQNELGIKQALDLYEEDLDTAETNGFITSIKREILEDCYTRYSQKLLSLENLDVSDILTDIREELLKFNILPINKWTPDFKQNTLPVLLADLAAVWTIQESKDVASIKKKIEPHCVQILCILRLLGVDQSTNGIHKHLAQVLTGQGKSIILVLLSSLIALTGHEARIICYSRYLASRDENSFKEFFETFDEFEVKSRVLYSTFGDMIEETVTLKVNGQEENVRSLVEKLLMDKLQNQTIELKKKSRDVVLLIDEADVFFSGDFYGQTYDPCSTLKMTALLEIQPKLWELVESGIDTSDIVLERIKTFTNELIKDEKYDDLKHFIITTNCLFEKHLKEMILSAIHASKEKRGADSWYFKQFKINNGIICSRDEVGTHSPSIRLGYYNIFFYFRLKKSHYEHKNYQNYGYIHIGCGKLSYANMPLELKNIIGVSGTLTTLSEPEKNAIQKYGINTMSVMPSFFGDRKLKFDPNHHVCFLENEESWHSKIFDRISEEIRSYRALIVFFDTDDELAKFKKKFCRNIDRLYTLIGDEEPEDMEFRINEAGVSQTVTLGTRAMGRGVDFKSNDLSVEKNGGVHVIQTFFSFDEKEQTQIQGRTARKDNDGSYEMVLCRLHLELMKCNKLPNGKTVSCYQELCIVRQQKASEEGAIIESRLKEAEKEHNLTMDFIKSLSNYTPEKRNQYLSKYPFCEKW